MLNVTMVYTGQDQSIHFNKKKSTLWGGYRIRYDEVKFKKKNSKHQIIFIKLVSINKLLYFTDMNLYFKGNGKDKQSF